MNNNNNYNQRPDIQKRVQRPAGGVSRPASQPIRASSKNGAAPGSPTVNVNRVQSGKQNYGGRRQVRKKKTSGCLITAVILLLILLVLGIGIFAIVKLYKPNVGNKDKNKDTTTAPVSNVTDAVTDENNASDTEQDYVPTISRDGADRREECYTVLVCGHDNVSNNTDVMMVATFDVAQGAISIMQIPRDTYTIIDGKSRKMNSLYQINISEARASGEENLISGGMRGFADDISNILGIPIDYWVLADLGGFIQIVEKLGGVDMDVPCDMKYEDPEQDLYIDLKAGYQHLTGAQAEQFVRFRKGYVQGDIGRVDAMKLFLAAFAQSLRDNLNLGNVGGIVNEIIGMINTDLSVMDCVYFAKSFLTIDLDGVTVFTMPGKDARANGDSGAWYYVAYKADTFNAVNQLLNPYNGAMDESEFDRFKILYNPESEYMEGLYNTEMGDLFSYLHHFGDVSDSVDIKVYN